MIPAASSEQSPWVGASSALVLLFLVATLWWWPFVDSGSPYLYHEDEAHHFNRIVDMVRTGDLDPHYFHKPSLHFYLRIPAVIAGFLWEVRAGNARSIKEVRTRDPEGLAGYAFSASHPGILRASRLFTLLVSILILFATYQLGAQLSGLPAVGVAAAVLVLLSTEFSRYSAFIGVDTIMTLMAVTAVVAAVSCVRCFSLGTFIAASFVAGLAISSKYNALPIVLVPLFTLIACRRLDFLTLLLALVMPALGFVVGSPYVLSSLPLFTDQLSYEVWHYGIAGHAEHTAEPGLSQLLHYSWWLTGDGIGVVATFFAVAGFIFVLIRRTREGVVVSAFPLLFLLLMCAQRANFERNMIVLIPFVAVWASYGALRSLEALPVRSAIRHWGFGVLMLAATIQPFFQTVALRHQVMEIPETRRDAEAWLRSVAKGESAVATDLEFSRSALILPSVESFAPEEQTLAKLALAGFDHALVDASYLVRPEDQRIASLVHTFHGIPEKQRVTANPTIRVFDLSLNAEASAQLRGAVADEATILLTPGAEGAGCARRDAAAAVEGHCWIEKRIGQLQLAPSSSAPQAGGVLHLSVMSPWAEQRAEFQVGNSASVIQELSVAGEWVDVQLPITAEALLAHEPIWVTVQKVQSPKAHGLNEDPRRLGIAIRAPRIEAFPGETELGIALPAAH